MNARTTPLRRGDRTSEPDVRGAVTAPVMEVFPSIQGEGAFVGEPQTFVRLAGCPLRCRYCDTPASWARPVSGGPVRPARLVAADGTVTREEGWATAFRVLCFVAAAEGVRPRTISVTGGEPLVHVPFLLELARLRGPRRLHLETAGAHPEALARVLEHVQHVSLDLKLEGDLDDPVETPGDAERPPRTAADWRAARRDCLDLVRGRDACAKVVVCGGGSPEELERVLDDVVESAPELLVVLQPATPVGGAAAPSPQELDRAVELARERDLRLRVLPQVHRALRLP